MRLLVTCLALVVAATFPAYAAPNVAGKTIKYMNAEGQTYWTTYHQNGTTSSKSTMNHSSAYIYDTGKWWIKKANSANSTTTGATACNSAVDRPNLPLFDACLKMSVAGPGGQPSVSYANAGLLCC